MKTWQVQDDRRRFKRTNRPTKRLVDIRSPYSWVCKTAPAQLPACNQIVNGDDSTLHFTRMNSVPKLRLLALARMIWFCTCYTVLQTVASLFTTRSSACSQPPPAIEPQTLGVMMQTKSVIFATTFLSARMYAAELEHTFNRPPPTSCLPLKLAAVQQIREAVLTSAIFSDELILGVLFLALSHNKNIDPLNEDQYHIDAAEKMIKARGGLYKLKCDQSIVNLFLWCRQTQGNSSLCLGNILDV
ncbi:unnamed protein product [Clonostachys rosea f. rosea IK726]|uniref:Uncharacterized protein n=1 Tax=Clonostachys rosea f. rosea IK726 TaxID=1349383 RepID=A0ACA9UC86_BIOOC|nr:unnamed protein product [Clonostachys rosea f. rosea IK726]